MSSEPHQADQTSEAVPQPSQPDGGAAVVADPFHTDKMILFSGVCGALATLGFIAVVILHFLAD
ncbi:hypothetical protein [Azospirillum sp.]|uniref:hypothetical protein n=1 Tax=Azospirillum sp. TaxID=34012 RepID=UPI003D717DAB